MTCNLNIHRSQPEDLPLLMRIYDRARSFMSSNGNPGQWTGGYPSEQLILSEILSGHSYVCEDADGSIAGTFCFIIGEDPTYAFIEDGEWLSDATYGTIHRLASAGHVRGVAKNCIEWCWTRIHNLRADTHENNILMRNILESNGFRRCGIIYTDNGTARIAYQKCDSGGMYR